MNFQNQSLACQMNGIYECTLNEIEVSNKIGIGGDN